MCELKVVLFDVAKVQDPLLPQSLNDIVKSLNNAQKDAVKELGFSGLFNIKVFDMSYELQPWLVGRYD